MGSLLSWVQWNVSLLDVRLYSAFCCGALSDKGLCSREAPAHVENVALFAGVVSGPESSTEHCCCCRRRAVSTDMGSSDVFGHLKTQICPAQADSAEVFEEKEVEDEAWILRQYYNGIGDEELDNISNYSAK